MVLTLSLSLAFANENSNAKVSNEIFLNSVLTIKNSSISPDGICWVDVYYRGVYVGTEYSNQPSYEACQDWVNSILEKYEEKGITPQI